MTPEQMRELADILEPMAAAPRFDGLPVAEFCAWLRQCAEQRPDGWKLVPVEPTPEMLSAVGMMDGYDWHAPGCSPDADHANWYSAMIAAAPAAPQAEPKREPLSDEREARLTRERDALAKAMQTCVWALRQPLDDWKGECERKALDAANAALAQIEQERSDG